MEYNCHIFLKCLVFQAKNLVFQINLVSRSETLDFDKKKSGISNQKFEILTFSHIEFEILGISREMLSILKKM